MKKIIVSLLFATPAVLLASSGNAGESQYFMITGRETDFWPRVVNFVIFASLLYYLLANPVKNFFKSRKEGIAAQLKEIEEKLQAAKNEKLDAQTRLEESEAKAAQIIEDAKKEAIVLTKAISEANENELKQMEKQMEEKIALEERKSIKDTIDEVLNGNITTEDININEMKVVDIVKKKVA